MEFMHCIWRGSRSAKAWLLAVDDWLLDARALDLVPGLRCCSWMARN